MTEENQDSNTPKLRLSRQAEEAKPEDAPKPAPEPESEPTPKLKPTLKPTPKPTLEPKSEATSKSTPNLRLKRPTEEPQAESGEIKQTPPTLKNPSKTTPEASPSVKDKKAFDPPAPVPEMAKELKTVENNRLPPELPSKPTPASNDGSGQKLEEAINQIGEEPKSKGGLLTSIIVIFVLLLVLGGAGYGLYYLLQGFGGSPDDSTTTASETTESQGESNGLLSGPIEKAKAAISQKIDNDASEEVASLTEKKAEPAPVADEPEPKPAATEPEPEVPAAIAQIAQGSIAEFLKNAHIGGVRTGERPKLIMNGKSYNQGDLINPENGLRFIGLRDGKLAFRDNEGIIYIKSF